MFKSTAKMFIFKAITIYHSVSVHFKNTISCKLADSPVVETVKTSDYDLQIAELYIFKEG